MSKNQGWLNVDKTANTSSSMDTFEPSENWDVHKTADGCSFKNSEKKMQNKDVLVVLIQNLVLDKTASILIVIICHADIFSTNCCFICLAQPNNIN